MLFLFYIFVLLSIIVILFLVSNLKIEVKNFNASTLNPTFLKDGYLITIGLYIKQIPIIKFKFNKEKLENANLSAKIKKMNFKNYIKKIKPKKLLIKRIKFLKINIERINLDLSLDTIDPILTSYATAIVSSLIGMIFGFFIKKYDKEKQKFIVKPVYLNKNLINLNLSCIISIKIWNIIKEIINYRKLYFQDLESAKMSQL